MSFEEYVNEYVIFKHNEYVIFNRHGYTNGTQFPTFNNALPRSWLQILNRPRFGTLFGLASALLIKPDVRKY